MSFDMRRRAPESDGHYVAENSRSVATEANRLTLVVPNPAADEGGRGGGSFFYHTGNESGWNLLMRLRA